MAYSACFDEFRRFGVEIECYGVPNVAILKAMAKRGIECKVIDWTNEVHPTWRLSKDNSIEGEAATEVVSPVLSGRSGLLEVANVLEALREVGCQVNSSCGFHVHWFCGDYTGKNVLSLLRLYSKFEPVIDGLVAPSRRANKNKNCRSLVKDSDLSWITDLDPTGRARASEIATRFEMAYTEYHEDANHVRSVRSSRYHKVNLQSYPMYGTIEFRQHQGTLSTEKAINWIVFTQQLINKAKSVAVSPEPAAKVTLGELLRSLKMIDSYLFEHEMVDPLILHLAEYLKNRYAELKEADYDRSDLTLQETQLA